MQTRLPVLIPLAFCCCLVPGGIQGGVGSHQARGAAEPGLVRVESGDQQVGVARLTVIDFVLGQTRVGGELRDGGGDLGFNA